MYFQNACTCIEVFQNTGKKYLKKRNYILFGYVYENIQGVSNTGITNIIFFIFEVSGFPSTRGGFS